MQRDCLWVSELTGQGFERNAVNQAVEDVRVQYSPMEVQAWASAYDVVLIQELDPLLREALGRAWVVDAVCGASDVDGRGLRVDACTGLLLRPGSGARAISSGRGRLEVRLGRGGRAGRGGRRVRRASREHVAALVERKADGERAVFCSVHLHPVSMVQQANVPYLEYLEPLKRAILAAAGDMATEDSLQVPCFLAGDFNASPEWFSDIIRNDPFWQQFRVLAPQGGDTAHGTNPDVQGDFALTSGGEWQGHALGDSKFGTFERYADRVTRVAGRMVRLAKAQAAFHSDRGLFLDLARAAAQADPAQPASVAGWHLGDLARQVGGADQSEQAEERSQWQVERELRRGRRRTLRKGLLNSDHRPLHFEGSFAAEPAVAEV